MLEHGICPPLSRNCRRRHRGPGRLGVAPHRDNHVPSGERGQGAEYCGRQRLIATPVKRCTASAAPRILSPV
jgi:hypothetical protein